MRLARRTPEEGRGRRAGREGGLLPLACLPLGRGMEDTSAAEEWRRECFWLFLLTKEQRRERERERERMDGRKGGGMDE